MNGNYDRKPNFFIVGAPKSGTTALFHYLSKHPDIYTSAVKEPYFFGNDLIYRMRRPTLKQYLDLFTASTCEKMLGEASVTYLYSKSAAQEIYDFNPESKIIIMLRNPIEMMYSLHSQVLFTGFENVENFKEALSYEERRKKLQNIPAGCLIVNFLFYKEFANYPNQVSRYLNLFPKENIRIIIFDDFKKNTKKEFKNTIKFLDVDSEFCLDNYQIINSNEKIVSKRLQNLWGKKFIRQIARIIVPKKSIRHSIMRLNVSHKPRPPMKKDLKNKLYKEFSPLITELSKILDQNLNYWFDK